jgi:hypothetical protein
MVAKSEKKMEKAAKIQANLKNVKDDFRYKCDEINEKHKHLQDKTQKKERELFLQTLKLKEIENLRH